MLPVAQAPDLNTDRRAVERGEFEASKIKSFRFIVKYHPGEEKREGFEGRSCQSFRDEAEARGGDARSKEFFYTVSTMYICSISSSVFHASMHPFRLLSRGSLQCTRQGLCLSIKG